VLLVELASPPLDEAILGPGLPGLYYQVGAISFTTCRIWTVVRDRL